MRFISIILLASLIVSCQSARFLRIDKRNGTGMSGTEFYKLTTEMKWAQRDSIAEKAILSGNMPSFLFKLVEISTSIVDSSTSKTIKASYWVTPDYLSIGTSDDWARIPLTPMTAQRIADSFDCFLPTRKMVNDIYAQAKVKLEPVPLFAFRDSSIIFWHHHLIIEGQRKGREGLIAGIKKDVVISDKLTRDPKKDRVAIYGWHKPDGNPIQPLYTGHVNWYVDYSHGIRLVSRKIKVNGKWMDYTDVMKDPVLKKLLCDEDACDVTRYYPQGS